MEGLLPCPCRWGWWLGGDVGVNASLWTASREPTDRLVPVSAALPRVWVGGAKVQLRTGYGGV